MDYKDKVVPLLRKTRDDLISGWGNVEVIKEKNGRGIGAVTELDLKVEQTVAMQLKHLYPDIAFVGEEFGGDRTANKLWLMDPIDGTGYYLRGLPFCTSMIALVEDGKIIFSAIYDFINDDMYWAERGKGSFKNETPIKVSNRSLAESYISFETHIGKEENQKIIARLAQKSGVSKIVAAGWDFAMIASGKLDGRINFDPWGKDYDFASGSLLVEEAGGVVHNLHSKSYDYKNVNFIASNRVIYKELTEGSDALFPIQ